MQSACRNSEWQRLKKLGFETCILPKVCLDMVKEIKGIKLLGVGNISDAINLL